MKTRRELLDRYPWLRLGEPNDDGTVAPPVSYRRLTGTDLLVRAPRPRAATLTGSGQEEAA